MSPEVTLENVAKRDIFDVEGVFEDILVLSAFD